MDERLHHICVAKKMRGRGMCNMNCTPDSESIGQRCPSASHASSTTLRRAGLFWIFQSAVLKGTSEQWKGQWV